MSPIIIVIIGVVLTFGVPIILLINVKFQEKYNYQCTKCLHIYDIFENQFNYSLLGASHRKCPKCGSYSFAKVVRKE